MYFLNIENIYMVQKLKSYKKGMLREVSPPSLFLPVFSHLLPTNNQFYSFVYPSFLFV